MTNDEAYAFMRDEVLVAFPAVRAHVIKNSRDQARTLQMWARALTDLTVEECRVVLDDWIIGKVAMPKLFGEDMDRLAVMIREIVHRSRYEAKQREERLAMRQERVAPGTITSMAEAFLEMCEAAELYRDGQIGKMEMNLRHDVIIDNYMHRGEIKNGV